jgi:hypothetical protein
MADLDDVCSGLDGIEKAIEKKGGWLTWWWVWIWVFIIVFDWIPDAWHSNMRYEIQYQVPANQVIHFYRPSDCSFLTSPLGYKGCRYERVVTTSQVDGKTQVLIDWQKIEDPKLVD